jgi:hypothetical protein
MSRLNASQLLAAWQTAERQLASRDPDAADFEELLQEAERLRSECGAANLNEAALVDHRQRMAAEPEGGVFG